MADEIIEVIEYVNDAGKNAVAEWIKKLDISVFTKVAAVIERMKLGNFGDAKSVGEGVSERRIDFGPGYRLYFGRDGGKLVILLGGGTKRRQQKDIEAAKLAWAEYKRNKRRK
ncbi:MAG: type II toxin-antitoxin system RelE/ParE family toxin [Planctomycetes bacterium]|nr:type II toxin-antitoxin system RelE/ParE family toxin [Planctomycetota bacterium]